MFTYSIKGAREIRKFQIVVVQRRQRNVQNSVMHVQSCFLLIMINMLFFCCSPCRRRRRWFCCHDVLVQIVLNTPTIFIKLNDLLKPCQLNFVQYMQF